MLTEKQVDDKLLKMKLTNIGIHVSISYLFYLAKIYNINDIICKTPREMKKIPHISSYHLRYVDKKLRVVGLRLYMTNDEIKEMNNCTIQQVLEPKVESIVNGKMNIDEFNLNLMTREFLKKHGIDSVMQLLQLTEAELLSIPNINEFIMTDIRNCIKPYRFCGLYMGFGRDEFQKKYIKKVDMNKYLK